MKRFRELVAEIRNKYPAEDFFADFEESCRLTPQKRRHYQSYNRALMTLDEESWSTLKDKALSHYLNERKGQRKEAFFNHLNEAFAYRYLWRKGFASIQILKDTKKGKTPDIRFIDCGSEQFCEVKSVGITDEEIKRRENEPDQTRADYSSLPPAFLRKLKGNFNKARAQIESVGGRGLVFILVRFDNPFSEHNSIYKKQITEFCKAEGFQNLIVKIGYLGKAIIRF